MRHLLANIFTYALIAGLVLISLAWAWMRSEQLVITDRVAIEPRAVTNDTTGVRYEWYDFGRATYRANCQNCHTSDGSGRGMYPPVQRMSAHLAAEGGRAYLVNLTLYGLYTGTYGAPMPPMPELSDAQVAAVTNYVLQRFGPQGEQLGPEQLYSPREVTAYRGRGMSEWDVAASRPAVPSARELGKGVAVADDEGMPAVPEGKDD